MRMVKEQVDLARAVAKWLANHNDFHLLQQKDGTEWWLDIFMVVLFQARDTTKNETLVSRINDGRVIYVSGTSWNGQKAARIAIANWQANLKEDFKVITEALEAAIKDD
jgi:hypothetical protein